MGSLSESIRAQLEETSANIDRYQMLIKERAIPLVDKIDEEIMKKFGEFQSVYTEKAFREAVDEFYSPEVFKPKYYLNRNYSLYDLYSPRFDPYGVLIDDFGLEIDADNPNYLSLFDRAQITKDRSGSDSLFDTVFIEGWHGGAKGISSSKEATWGKHPAPGTAYYRTRGMVTYPDGTTKSHKYGKWGREAVRTTSAYNLFKRNMEMSGEEALDREFERLGNERYDRLNKEVGAEMASIWEEVFSRG